MRTVEPMKLGLVFWAEKDADTSLRQLDILGLHAGQLGVPPTLDCQAALSEWKEGLKHWNTYLSSVVCSYAGEDYTNLKTVHDTVGFTTATLRPERIARTQVVSRFGHALGITALSCHIGFIPEDRHEILYTELRDLTCLLCDSCAANDQDFVLETGQESADVLLAFIQDVDRKNLKVNFDPANMVLYNSGDPIAALAKLSPHVLSVHCKDGHFPAGEGLLGTECALGDGEVDFPAFLQLLKKMQYRGLLTIEREEPDAEKRITDIRIGIDRLNQWKAQLSL